MATSIAPVRARLFQADAAPLYLGVAAFFVLYWQPLLNTMNAWWSNPDAGHGLLLAPLAIWLAWRAGLAPERRPQPVFGLIVIVVAVLLRYVSALAAEAFIARASMLIALGGIVIWWSGWRQLYHWWLPVLLLGLSMPLPEIIVGSLALPLQFQASKLGAALLATRGIPVQLDGNVIRLPGHDLFVTEACSGLRSLTALLSIGVLLGGLVLRSPLSRFAIVALTIPVAVLINGVRVFGTGFLVAFVNPALAEGFSHMTEGWLLFVVALVILGGLTRLVLPLERRWLKEGADAAAA